MAKSRLATLRRPSLSSHHGPILVSFRSRLGTWNHHHACFWSLVLDNIAHDAQIHHEKSFHQGYLRLWIFRVWEEQACV